MALTVEFISKEGPPVLKYVKNGRTARFEVDGKNYLFVRPWGGFVTVRISADLATLAPKKHVGRLLDRSAEGDTSVVYLNGDDATVDVNFNVAYLGDSAHRYARATVRRMTETVNEDEFEW